MKCLVLAGGSSERLWPLSRKDYPKQFMELREGRSMFQETILRNIPFCDEFIILTNKMYEHVARGQLQVFQSLEYTLVLEEAALKTAPAVTLTALSLEDDEELMITPCDSIIDGDYSASITRLKDAVKEDKFAVIACKPKNYGKGYNYLRSGKKVVFGVKPAKGCLWDTGIWGAKASVFRDSLDKDFIEECKALDFSNGIIGKEGTEDFTPISLIKAVVPKNAEIIPAAFEWTRITDISSYYGYYNKAVKNDNTICHNSKGVEVVNKSKDQLIIANGIKNVAIVNTRDAIFVTASLKEADIKDIVSKVYPTKKKYFDQQPKKYASWGISEFLGASDDYSVRIITVFERESVKLKPKKNTVLNLFVTSGSLAVETKEDEAEYFENHSFTLSEPMEYTLYNTGKGELEIICTEKTNRVNKVKQEKKEYLVKMKPVFKDNLWGGTKIRDVFGKNVGNLEIIAESWELSAHKDGQSRIAFGEFAGKTLSEYLKNIGRQRIGWKAQAYEEFPIMVKFIDARQNISIQVHPTDEYAIMTEGQYGKNEMWHILEAEDDACIYVGFKQDITAEEVRKRIADNTLMQVINKIPVKKGDTYFLKAGTVHAIGAGCLICEVQQSSNVTYRLYDYGRRDKNGNLRELHIDKALDVLDMKAYEPQRNDDYEKFIRSDYVKTLIGQCKYFMVNKYYVDGECYFPAIESSFRCFVALSGNGLISDGVRNHRIASGDTWFAASRTEITVEGKLTMLVVNL